MEKELSDWDSNLVERHNEELMVMSKEIESLGEKVSLSKRIAFYDLLIKQDEEFLLNSEKYKGEFSDTDVEILDATKDMLETNKKIRDELKCIDKLTKEAKQRKISIFILSIITFSFCFTILIYSFKSLL